MSPRVGDGRPDPSSHQLLWRVNETCNLSCPYCFRAGIDLHRQISHPAPLAPDRVARALAVTGFRWRIHLTGGEPFLLPGFVDLARALTRHNTLSVNTNLVAGTVEHFAKSIDPAAVHSINASFHRPGFPRGEGFVERFFRNLALLREKGFRVRTMVVLWPPRLGSVQKELETLRTETGTEVYPKLFRGIFAGRPYPAAFTAKERRLLHRLGLPQKERRILAGDTRFTEQPCAAGHTALDMDQDGRLFRCSGVRESRGHLLEGSLRLDDAPTPCPAHECACPYQGIKFTHRRRGWSIPGWLLRTR